MPKVKVKEKNAIKNIGSRIAWVLQLKLSKEPFVKINLPRFENKFSRSQTLPWGRFLTIPFHIRNFGKIKSIFLLNLSFKTQGVRDPIHCK